MPDIAEKSVITPEKVIFDLVCEYLMAAEIVSKNSECCQAQLQKQKVLEELISRSREELVVTAAAVRRTRSICVRNSCYGSQRKINELL